MKDINITKPQIQFLAELYKGLTISLCIEPSNQFGEFIGKDKFSGNIQRKSIFKLGQLGLVIFEHTSYRGIRYFECCLSDYGRDFIGGKYV